MSRLVIFSFFLFGLIACSPKIQDTAGTPVEFAKAKAMKTETESIQEGIKADFQVLRERRNSMMVQGRALTSSELTFIEKINDLVADQGRLLEFQDEIAKSEDAYEPNAKELLYLNEQANKVVKKIQKKISKLKEKSMNEGKKSKGE